MGKKSKRRCGKKEEAKKETAAAHNVDNLVDNMTAVSVSSSSEKKPALVLEMMTPDEVERRTGFSDLKSLMQFAAIVCGGDLDAMAENVTEMTFLEEWLLYFEIAYGKQKSTWQEYESEYKMSFEQGLWTAFTEKLNLALAVSLRWPPPTDEELARLRSEDPDATWNETIGSTNKIPTGKDIADLERYNRDLNRAWSFQVNFMDRNHAREIE